MACDRCDECRETGMKYCAYCGEDLREDCPVCDEYRAKGANYCCGCGKKLEQTSAPVQMRPANEPGTVIGKICGIMAVLAVAVLIVEASYLIGGTVSVFEWAGEHSYALLGLLPNLVVITVMSGTVLQVAWILIEVSVIASLLILAYQSVTVMRSEGETLDKVKRTPLYQVALIYGATLALDILISLIATPLGGGIEAPDDMDLGNVPAALFAYADAAVWEEVISRLVPMGIPIAVAALIIGRKDGWKCIFGGFGVSRFGIVLLLISSAMFGFAHMSGWGIEKVLPTFASGILMGYIYMKVGIHASIAVHFLTDYLAVVMFTSMMIPMSFIMLAMIGLGFVCLFSLLLDARRLPETLRNAPNWVPPVQESIFSKREED